MKENLLAIINHFDIGGEVISINLLDNGHINDTYSVKTNKITYVLQRINHQLFTNVEGLMDNIQRVTDHIKAKNHPLATLSLVKSSQGKNYYFDGQNYYRVYEYIDHSVCLNEMERDEDFYEVGKAFGEFTRLLGDFDATKLFDILPNFHNTEVRYHNFSKALVSDRVGRASLVREEVDFVKKRIHYASHINRLFEKELIPYRVTHNDTKLNNILLDDQTYKPKAVIDLDTIMSGTLLYDFGDAIRYGCNRAKEDEQDLSLVQFDLDLFSHFTKGYLQAMGKEITMHEIDNLAMSAIILTYECGMRFLSDYLDGDRYFKIEHPQHNLDRARTQFRLVELMEDKLALMNEIVKQSVQK